MNTISEDINVQAITKSCRNLNLDELMLILRRDIMMFYSWGAHAFKIDNKNNIRMFRMSVSGRHHKGHVYIFLSALDLFDVYLTTAQGKIKRIEIGLYNDMLTNWIDEAIEKCQAISIKHNVL